MFTSSLVLMRASSSAFTEESMAELMPTQARKAVMARMTRALPVPAMLEKMTLFSAGEISPTSVTASAESANRT